jgi:hypothetical protein
MYVFDTSISSAVVSDGRNAGNGKEAHSGEKPRKGPLSPEMLDKMQRYWQASNYLTIGQI